MCTPRVVVVTCTGYVAAATDRRGPGACSDVPVGRSASLLCTCPHPFVVYLYLSFFILNPCAPSPAFGPYNIRHSRAPVRSSACSRPSNEKHKSHRVFFTPPTAAGTTKLLRRGLCVAQGILPGGGACLPPPQPTQANIRDKSTLPSQSRNWHQKKQKKIQNANEAATRHRRPSLLAQPLTEQGVPHHSPPHHCVHIYARHAGGYLLGHRVGHRRGAAAAHKLGILPARPT